MRNKEMIKLSKKLGDSFNTDNFSKISPISKKLMIFKK